VIINKTLPMQKQIEKFANEPVAFYLHKNRNFIEKLQNKSRKNNFDESVRRIEKDVEAINKKGLQDLWCIFNNIDPSSLIYSSKVPPPFEGKNKFDPTAFLRQKKMNEMRLKRARN
jgi:hypothetical protein